MEKGEVIKEICQLLLDGDKPECERIAIEKYPFVSALAEKRRYTPIQQTKIL